MIHHICKRKILIHYYLDWTVNTLSGLRAWTGYLGGGSTLRLNTYHSAASLVTQHMIHAASWGPDMHQTRMPDMHLQRGFLAASQLKGGCY